jgi:hypothetical protein
VTDVQACCHAEETNCFIPICLDISFPEVTEDFDLYSFIYGIPFWNKLTVDEILVIRKPYLFSCAIGILLLEMILISTHMTDLGFESYKFTKFHL